ncbi:hypothetical protein GALMADRAFT_251995 [Galerina marginata CBS 339.88]|uniref:ER transporter 6TM N-terminal domain-containing protein n=1 Tax=Galerina marginata (strain CBS 339.88) TaxID=685588 RepID=A0A067T2X3_GALM3|nr:hypothetical protein GALMADRAFT_251995 [Galerina marginata CBS 339.88]
MNDDKPLDDVKDSSSFDVEKGSSTPTPADRNGSPGRAKTTPNSPSKELNAKTVVVADRESDDSSSSSDGDSFAPTWLLSIVGYLQTSCAWIPQHLTWSDLKPAIRCAVVAWVSLVLFLVPSIEVLLGNAGFLIVIAAVLSPPAEPFIEVFEREMLILLFASAAWAWCCFGLFCANLARRVKVPNVTLFQAVDGRYIEAGPAVIIAVFIFIGSGTFLSFRAKQGPGPYLFPCVLACLCIDISLTTGVLFPFPFYLIGKAILLPLALHTAISLLASIVIFPSTVSARFTSRLSSALSPFLSVLEKNRTLLSTPLTAPEFAPLLASVRADTKKCEAGLVPLASSGRLLKSDLIYGRFSPRDFKTFQGMFRRLAGRADGLGLFFALVDPARERFPGTRRPTPAPTTPGTPKVDLSRPASRAPSVERPVGAVETNSRHDLEPDSPLSPISTSHRSLLSQPVAQGSSPSVSISPTFKHSHSLSVSHAHLHLHNPLRHSEPTDSNHQQHSQSQSHGHLSLFNLARARARKSEFVVGTFQSQRYLDLEATHLFDPDEENWNENLGHLLNDCCDPLLESCVLGLTSVGGWLSTVRDARLSQLLRSVSHLGVPLISPLFAFFGFGEKKAAEERTRRQERIDKVKELRGKIASVLEKFRQDTRHVVLEPYQHGFEDSSPIEELKERQEGVQGKDDEKSLELDKEDVMPPHRCLFNCFVYQYNLMQISSIILEMLDEIIRLDDERQECRLWTPVHRLFTWTPWSLSEPESHFGDDDDPDVIQGIKQDRSDTESQSEVTTLAQSTTTDTHMPSSTTGPAFRLDPEADLGIPKRRNPDALPPQNMMESVMRFIHEIFANLGSIHVLFGIKTGLLTVALSLPSLFKTSTEFAYDNRFVWGVFIAQLTTSCFRGETLFGISTAIISTFFGAIVGMTMWYISCGSAHGNAFGLAAVCAVCFPFFFYARIYWPIPPMRNVIFFVTAILVIAYSYQDVHLNVPGSPGFGFSVGWKRFVAVTGGVVAAFIASFFPPSTTIRLYERNLLAKTSSELGTIYCAILSFANTKHEPEIQEIITSLIAVRNKLQRSVTMRTNVGYEFSLRGRWPADRYKKVTDLQIPISFSLSHLMSILEHLDPSWSRALLRRTRFMDPTFQGDVLAVISLISFSLRTGCPLPQITPCPLIDRFMFRYHGLEVIHKDAEEDYGLPRTLSIDLLKDEQYLMFSVGISTAFALVTRLDRLMLAVKEIVGEHYHIHGVGLRHANADRV